MTDAFLDEVARLLPDVDVVRLRQPDPTIEPVPEEVARERWRDEVRRVAAALVTGWPAWFPSIPPPEQVTVRWSIGDRADEAAAEVAGQFQTTTTSMSRAPVRRWKRQGGRSPCRSRAGATCA